MTKAINTFTTSTCFHCGEDCRDESVTLEDKAFCCEGCKMVYGILSENDLCQYYDIEKNPGISQRVKLREGKFAFLDDGDALQEFII